MKANKEILIRAIEKGFKPEKILGNTTIRQIGNAMVTDGANEVDKESTLYDILDWLREIHMIFVEVTIDCTTEPKYCYTLKRFFGNPKDLTEKEWYWETRLEMRNYPETQWFLYRTHEEALHEGLLDALKLL